MNNLIFAAFGGFLLGVGVIILFRVFSFDDVLGEVEHLSEELDNRFDEIDELNEKIYEYETRMNHIVNVGRRPKAGKIAAKMVEIAQGNYTDAE
jgi:hypothetical protein